MRILIDVPESVYERIREYYEKNDTVESTYSYIYHGTPIPDNATNGDVIKAIFDPETSLGIRLHCSDFWWNELYQKGGKE